MTFNLVKDPILKSFPKIKVIRKDYCSQKMTDKIVSYLEENYPQRLLRLLEEENSIRAGNYFTALREVIFFAKEKFSTAFVNVDSSLAWIDVSYELSRRLRAAYGLPEIKVSGIPLAPQIDGPYPSLQTVPLDEWSVARGLRQADADLILDTYYKNFSRQWYYRAEAIRRKTGHENEHSPAEAIQNIMDNLSFQYDSVIRASIISHIYLIITQMCKI